MAGVELRLTEVEPPSPDPPRTIYTDLVNLPDPIYLGVEVRIFNYDDVALYMRVDGYATGWTFTSNDFGSVASGGNIYRNIDNFGTRAKPAAPAEEDITIRLRAYTDAGYTNLKWTYERVVHVVYIKSDDGSWTQDVLNNFDDGTVQGWAWVNESYVSGSTLAVAVDYVLSNPYSLKLDETSDGGAGTNPRRARLYKSFTTPNRNNVFAIIDIRTSRTDARLKNLRVQTDGTILMYIGRAHDTVTTDYRAYGRWWRIVIPLPKNTTLELRFVDEWWIDLGLRHVYIWLDDFKIISKD